MKRRLFFALKNASDKQLEKISEIILRDVPDHIQHSILTITSHWLSRSPSPWQDPSMIPRAILENIFTFINQHQLSAVMCTCKNWRASVLYCPALWRTVKIIRKLPFYGDTKVFVNDYLPPLCIQPFVRNIIMSGCDPFLLSPFIDNMENVGEVKSSQFREKNISKNIKWKSLSMTVDYNFPKFILPLIHTLVELNIVVDSRLYCQPVILNLHNNLKFLSIYYAKIYEKRQSVYLSIFFPEDGEKKLHKVFLDDKIKNFDFLEQCSKSLKELKIGPLLLSEKKITSLQNLEILEITENKWEKKQIESITNFPKFASLRFLTLSLPSAFELENWNVDLPSIKAINIKCEDPVSMTKSKLSPSLDNLVKKGVVLNFLLK